MSDLQQRLAEVLRQRAQEAFDEPCEMGVEQEDCASCSRPIQAFSWIDGRVDTVFGEASAIAEALLSEVRAFAAEQLREVATEIEDRVARAKVRSRAYFVESGEDPDREVFAQGVDR